ncbi:hypothetical protein IID23_01800 [Patescibacteria group bacterium]|nr:hypothetical protein [Patescibacteria group bacterium]
MRLYEFEGLKLFREAQIPIPEFTVLSSIDEIKDIELPVVVKAQVLSGSRGKAGLVIPCKSLDEVKKALKEIIGKEVNGEKIEKVLIETYFVDKAAEYYLSITYDTSSRSPIALISKKGGVDIEKLASGKESVKSVQIDPMKGLQPWQARQLLSEAGFSGIHFLSITKILLGIWRVFQKHDARLVEINPLIETEDEEFFAADAKIILDDDADFRQTDTNFPPRDVLGKKPTKSELAAKEIDANDHRGSAGSTYIELDGNIAVIAAGGGGSLVNMDALMALGGKPANYTEHSGNPPREKLEKLSKIILSKKGLSGVWFVGATANFTDIYETLSGFVDALRSIKPKPKYPIVIRRGGPRYEEAFKMLEEVKRKEGFAFHVFGPETPMTSTARTIVDFANKFRKKR